MMADYRLWWDEAKSLVALSLPIVLTNLGQIAIRTTDVVLIGWLGPHALAASALGINVTFVFEIFALGVMLATAPMMAQDLGRRRHAVREPRRTMRQGFWAAALLTLPASLLLWEIAPILRLLGQEEGLIELAEQYVHAVMWGFLPTLWFAVLRNFIAALARPRAGMVVMLGGVAFNALAAYALIFGAFGLPALGLWGAGLATSVTNWLLFLVLLGYLQLDRRFRRYHLLGRFWRFDWPRLFEIFRLGLPIAVTFLMEVGLFAASGFLMGWIGAAALAAHQIALQCAGVTFMVPLGLSQGGTVRVGLAAGRNDAAGIRRAGLLALGLGFLFMATMAVPMWTVPEVIIGWFLDADDPANGEVVRLAASFLLIAAWFQIFDGGQVIGGGVLRGLKDTRWPMVLAALAYWVVGIGAAAGLAFGLDFGGRGIWIGLAAALAAAAVLMIGRFVLLMARWPGRTAEPAPVQARVAFATIGCMLTTREKGEDMATEDMATKTIITCAVTGNLTRPEQHPNLPITPEQIASAAIDAAKAGAAIAHIHVRDPATGLPSMALELYREVVDRIRASDTDLIINLTTGPGGRFVPSDDDPKIAAPGTTLVHPRRRVEHVVALKPEICSLDLNTMWFGSAVVINTPKNVAIMAEAIRAAGVTPELEVFDSGDIQLAHQLLADGTLPQPPLFQVVVGIRNGFPATPETLLYARSQLPMGARWAAMGIGRMEFPIVAQAAILGGHVRVGLEDNLYLSRGVLAPSNAALVERAATILDLLGHNVASPAEARAILGLRPPAG